MRKIFIDYLDMLKFSFMGMTLIDFICFTICAYLVGGNFLQGLFWLILCAIAVVRIHLRKIGRL